MYDSMFLMDVHFHVFPPQNTVWGVFGQTHEDAIERMDRNGIDMGVIEGISQVTPDQQRVFTDYTIEAIKRFPERFLGQMFVSPMWGKRGLDEMKRGADLGIRGLKLYPPGQGNYPLDSEMVDPLMELAAELGWWAMTSADIDSKVVSPHLAVRLAKRHPEVPLILSCMGMNPDVTHFVPDYVKDVPNLYLNTAGSPNLPQFVYKNPMAIIPDRMLFASGMPTLSPEVELKKVEVAEELYGLTKDEKRKILGENAARLFHIDISRIK
jgi:predicted TIM-barrel fold metal-dependent hydrolase